MNTPAEQAERVKALALETGFSVARVTRCDGPWAAGERLKTFVGEGRHGAMTWMENTLERRVHPTRMWPDARSAVVVGLNYGPERDPLETLDHKDEAAISVYARNRDYHDLMKTRLKRFASVFHRETGEEVKVFVDTAPLMEKPLAHLAGLGWQGKHTNLVSRTYGSWLFLGVMLTAAELAPDTPETDHCGSCQACLDACPTRAFPAPYHIDARRCISYLTIEHKGPIPRAFRIPMGNRVYGCDDCLAVCPWNTFAQVSQDVAFHSREALDGPKLAELAALDDKRFRTLFKGSPIKRIGRDRFIRNVMIALGNCENPALAGQAIARVDDESALVRGAAIWALGRLDPERFNAERHQRRDTEPDPDVRSEWH